MAKEAQYSWFNLTVVMVLCLGSLSYGFAFSVISNTIGQPNFYVYLDLSPDPASPKYDYSNRIIGACNGLFSVGGFLGALTMGWVCDAYGRKLALIASSVVTIIGGALSGGCAHVAMFLIGRLVTGHGVGMFLTLIPIYQAEITPPESRGFLGSQHGVILVTGYALAAWIGVGTYYSKNPAFQWRFPLCVECLFPLIIVLLYPVIPESPRWLVTHHQKEKAWEITQKLHHNPSNQDDSFATKEFYQMVSQIESDRALFEHETLLDLFRKPSYRKRMICGGLTTFACESSGILVTYNYAVVLYNGLGFSGVIPLILAALYTTVAVPGNYISALLVDRVGRRPLLIYGLLGCMIALCFEAALVASFEGTTNRAGLNAALFFLFLFVFIYAVCLDACGFVYCAEIFPTHIRPRGMAFSIGILFLSTIPYLSAAGTAFANVGWKYYLLFICVTAVNIPIVYLLFPETKGLSLEEINEKFGDPVRFNLEPTSDEERARQDESISVLAGARTEPKGNLDKNPPERQEQVEISKPEGP